MVDQPVTSEFIYPDPYFHGVLKTRLKPPRQQARLLVRQRIDTLLSEINEYPLTLIVAPAGSGKTTALAGFAKRTSLTVVWCRMTTDDDPYTLLCHLVAAFRLAGVFSSDHVCEDIIRGGISLESKQVSFPAPTDVLDLLVNELATVLTTDTVLILDDYHQADEKPDLRQIIERLIHIQPRNLNLVLSTRYYPLLDMLPTIRARGEMYHIEQHHLSFEPSETSRLFDLYNQEPLTDIPGLTALSRGWPLILQLIASDQSLCQKAIELATAQEGHTVELPDSYTARVLSACLDSLTPLIDEYMQQQVFVQQTPDIQNFLFITATLRWLDASIYIALPTISAIELLQPEVERRYLFLEPTHTGQFQYQPIFQLFLVRQARQKLDIWHSLHLQAAAYYQTQQDWEKVIYHLLEIGHTAEATSIMQQTARTWLKQGNALVLLTWLDRLPQAAREQPELLKARAAAYRQIGRFDQALHVYEQVEAAYHDQHNLEGQALALRGRAEVYLDTVQPAPAEKLLEQALQLLPPGNRIERSKILLLQAENWANRGRADIALRLETEARNLANETEEEHTDSSEGQVCYITLVPETQAVVPSHYLSPRLLLRSGRLNESRKLLESELGLQPHAVTDEGSIILAHREPLLLLALLYAMLGNGARAFAMATRGLLEALQSGSQLTEAVAHMRVGHAHQVVTPIGIDAARRHYEHSLELVDKFGVTRTKVEGCMGLALLHGHGGDMVEAERMAQEGLHIAETAGDEWIAALIWLALGGAAVANTDERAEEWLRQAHERFIRGGDTYGQAVICLWRAIHYVHTGTAQQIQHEVSSLLDLTQKYGYEGLLTTPTLYGPRDLAMLIPVLLHGRSLQEYSHYAQQLLRQAFPTVATDETVEDYHPGYTLRIQMLGSFRVWRGSNEVHSREWQREKARQLLQLLLTYRGQWIQREQICAWLWPDSDLDAAERQFKVTLNALNTALEPFRPPRTAPFFIRRQGLAYSFAPSYGCWIDVDEFELRTTSVPQSDPDFVLRNAQVAVNLYKGDYLAESLYDPWTLEERERLLARYLATATALAERVVEKGDIQQSIQLCEQVLRRDRCYEEAYQVLMRAYAQSGSRSQALRTYDRCVQALIDDLDIEPLPETTRLYEQIKHNENI